MSFLFIITFWEVDGTTNTGLLLIVTKQRFRQRKLVGNNIYDQSLKGVTFCILLTPFLNNVNVNGLVLGHQKCRAGDINSVAEHLTTLYKTLGSIPSTRVWCGVGM